MKTGRKKKHGNRLFFFFLILFCEQSKNGENKILLFSKQCHFENTGNNKNKNDPLNQTSFLFSRTENSS